MDSSQDDMRAELAELRVIISALTARLDALMEVNSDNRPSTTTTGTSSASQRLNVNRMETLKLMQDIEGRDRNLIITGVAEEEDEEISNILINAGAGKITLNDARRIGAKKDTEKPRPIRAAVHDKDTRDRLVQSGRNLKSKGNPAMILPDRSRAEREQINDMYQEASRRNESQPAKNGKVWAVVGKLKPRLRQIDPSVY